MTEKTLRVSYVLTVLVAVVQAIVSAGGVFAPALYRDNPLIRTSFHGQDIVTLYLAVPLLIIGLALELRGSVRGRLVWLAMLAYALYGNAFYLFGAAFNVFFLAYAALVGMSLYALLFSVPRIDVDALAAAFSPRTPRWPVVGYMLLAAAGLGMLWTAMSASFLFTGRVPAPIVASGHPTGVVFALDLTLIVPAMLLGAVWLLQRRSWGWLLAAVLSIKGAVYTLSLAVATVIVQRAGLADGSELPVWATLTLFGALGAGVLLWNVRTSRASTTRRTSGERATPAT